jgi:acyl-coenzyme A synthetase/AMP-(fatty) acid ligase
VVESAVVGLNDATKGQAPLALIVLRADSQGKDYQ